MAHTPGPWTACHHGKCKCKLIWSESSDHPIAQVVSGEWGDEYPNVRLVEADDIIGQRAEAYIERIVYGSVDEEVAEANACVMSAAPDLLAACEFGGERVSGPDLLRKAAKIMRNVGGGAGRYMADMLLKKAEIEEAAIDKAKGEG